MLIFPAVVAVCVALLSLVLLAFKVPKWIVLGAFLLSLYVAWWVYPRQEPAPLTKEATHTPPLAQPPPPAPVKEPKIILNVSPSEILAARAGKTDYQATVALSGYVNRWMPVAIRVTRVSSDASNMIIDGESRERRKALVALYFDRKEYEPRLSIVRPDYGVDLDAVCKYDLSSDVAVLYKDCELVSMKSGDATTPLPR